MSQYLYNKPAQYHMGSALLLCAEFTHGLFLFQKSHPGSFAALTRSISDTSITRTFHKLKYS